jgi:hypothetical protein
MHHKESHIETNIEEAIEFGMPKDIGKFGDKVILSYEAIEDALFNERMLSCVRSKPFTEEEMEEWKKADEYLDNLNWEEASKRVQFIDRPQQPDYDPWDDNDS